VVNYKSETDCIKKLLIRRNNAERIENTKCN
jgi:hypothetical protein